ncbi:23S rRNA (guanosine-2'-O-)-methyltransferase rlmB [hydrothermal vent metagenome]|uniref:23S rRNA (Guanosine-2'-O-)-methyltransferase rlmB n=1 Tax=hydrothermal vent metagenome TaxID=652676 RepID=A0A1W1EJ34_9ZZZZ
MIIYGKQVCLYALEEKESSIKRVYLAKKGLLNQEIFDKYRTKIKFLEDKWANNMARGGNHQGILIDIEDIEFTNISDIKEGNFIVILDGITDVGNIGAIVRTAYALGVDAIIATGVRQLNYGAITRSSSGALLDMPFLVSKNILDILNELSQVGFKSYGALMGGVDIKDAPKSNKSILILGSEGRGLSKRVINKLDTTVSIKMKRDFNSLNVSVAAGILIDRISNG